MATRRSHSLGQKIVAVQGPKNKTFPMKNYDRDTFTYETEDENAVRQKRHHLYHRPRWQSDTGGR
jgi:hypothetical protein